MLQRIRDKSQNWIAWVIVIAISALFALWGVGNFAGLGSVEKVVATVNGQKITDRQLAQQYQNLSNQVRQRSGANADINAPKLKQEALTQLINNHVFSYGLQQLGLSVSPNQIDQALATNPALMEKGQFSMDKFNQLVQNLGLTAEALKKEWANEYLFNQFRAGIYLSTFILPSEANQLEQLAMQERHVGYALLKTDHYLNQVTVTDSMIQAYYQKHKQLFYSKERVKIAYIVLSLDDIAKAQTVSVSMAKDFYQNNQSAYKTPAKRRVSQLFIKLAANASQAQQDSVQATLRKINKALKEGVAFSTLVTRYSEDVVSKKQAGDLGWVSLGQPPSTLEKAVFKLKKIGDVSAPIKTENGYQLVKLNAIQASKLIPFSTLQAQIMDRLKSQKAQQLYSSIGEKLSTLTFENPDNLSTAAQALKLNVRTSDYFTREGGKGDLANPKVMQAAFGDNVLVEGNNSDIINLSPKKAIVIRKVDFQKPALQSLGAVKSMIIQRIKQDKAKALAQTKAEVLLKTLNQGQSGVMLATMNDTTWVKVKAVSRSNKKIPPALLQAIFNQPRPMADKAINSVQLIPGVGYAVFSLSSVSDPAKLTHNHIYALSLQQGYTGWLLDAFKAHFKSKATIDIETKA